MIRWSVSVLTSLLLITNVQTAHASFASGQDLLTGFEAFERLGGGQGKPLDVAQSMRITGYIQGTIDSAISAGILCTKGKNLTLRTAQPMIAQYLQRNPSFLKKSGVEAVLMSLHPAYKCD